MKSFNQRLLSDQGIGRSFPTSSASQNHPLSHPDTPLTQHHAGTSEAPEPNRESRFAQLRAHAVDCAACELCDIGTRTVFGEGRLDAKIMLIGEQPGDQEDLSGRPFVGPAGALLDQNLREVGLERARLYVTNSVKHFRFVHRYGRRFIRSRTSFTSINVTPGSRRKYRSSHRRTLSCLAPPPLQPCWDAP